MNPNTGTHRKRVFLGAALVLVLSLSLAGPAWAGYLTDGTTETAPGVYQNPGDGFCVSGIKTDGTMTVVAGITNARDCVAYTTGLTGMRAADVTTTYGSATTCCTTGAANCTNGANPNGVLNWVTALQKCFDTSACTLQGATGNDGAKHTYATSLCINPLTYEGISRVDLDNTAANCQEKGGVLSDGLYGHPYGACSAYQWVYGGVKSDGTLPNISGGKGVTAADKLGFCYATMDMTSVPYTVVTCPSQKNLSLVCAGGANLGKTCTVATQAADCPTSTCVANTGWTAGTDAALYQSQASYDAGLGWSFLRVCTGGTNPGTACTTNTQCFGGGACPASPGNVCAYTYGTSGYLVAPLRGPDGVVPTVTKCDATAGPATAGTCVDLTGITTQGECLAIGGAWDNWLPVGDNVAPNATNQTVATTGFTSTIKKLDAITPILSGGGKFYSSPGSVCQKCHADQSRAYQERNKPGYVETGHRLAGDTAPWTTVGAEWAIKGVQCTICHATGKPTQQDVGVVVYANRTGTNAGLPRAASGHNQTEYGSHVTGVCYKCHGTPDPANGSAAANIPVSGGDFAPTSKNLAPIANEFLNSPHAKYIGLTSRTVDVITKTNLDSSFVGKICRTGSEVTDAATLRTSTSTTACVGAAGNGADITTLSACNCPTYGGTWDATTKKCGFNVPGSFDQTNCVGIAGGTWNVSTTRCDVTTLNVNTCAIAAVPGVWNPITAKCYDSAVCGGTAGKTWDSGTKRCAENLTTCQAQSDADGYPYVWSPTGAAGNPSLVTSSGAGCYRAFNQGAIVTTWWNGTAAKKIPNLDTTSNANCTTDAGSFWTNEGEGKGTANTVAYAASDQGNCMTCHDVHWSLKSTEPEAEPIRRECTTCHSHPNGEGSASGAPQVNLALINHSGGTGTPTENAGTDPNEACEICHMPKSSTGGSPMHLWRISTNAAYQTMGATKVNIEADPDGTYDNAAWVDLGYACGQCHNPGGPARTIPLSELASVAKGIHASAGKTYSVTFTTQIDPPDVTPRSTLRVRADAVVVCDPDPLVPCPTLTYDWNWGDNTTHGTGDPADHLYGAAGTYSITLIVRENGLSVGSSTRSVTVAATDGPPTASGTCTWNENTWTMDVADTSSDESPSTLQIVVDWGDGGVKSFGKQGTTISKAYAKTGSFTVTHWAIDSKLQKSNIHTCTPPATPTYFAISGTVYASNGTTPVGGAVVLLKKGTLTVASTTTGTTTGVYNLTGLRPGTYSITVARSGYKFANPAIATVQVGASKPGQDVIAQVPLLPAQRETSPTTSASGHRRFGR